MLYVERKEKEYKYNSGPSYKDLEVDEVDIGRYDDKSGSSHPVHWEQWMGLVERGNRQSLKLFRLSPKIAAARAPGPGPVRLKEWKVIDRQELSGTKVVVYV